MLHYYLPQFNCKIIICAYIELNHTAQHCTAYTCTYSFLFWSQNWSNASASKCQGMSSFTHTHKRISQIHQHAGGFQFVHASLTKQICQRLRDDDDDGIQTHSRYKILARVAIANWICWVVNRCVCVFDTQRVNTTLIRLRLCDIYWNFQLIFTLHFFLCCFKARVHVGCVLVVINLWIF